MTAESQEAVVGARAAALSVTSAMRRLARRQDPHSVFLTGAAFFFSLSLAIDLALHRPGLDPWVLWLLLAFCLSLGSTAVIMGRHFPVGIGLVCVTAFAIATAYFVSPWGDTQSAVSSAQELPILALYLGWFVPRPLGRILMLLVIALLAGALAINPLFASDGALGVPSGAQMLIVALFCFEIGSMLWRRSEKRIKTDQLTGVLNRAGFLSRLDRELVRSGRSGIPMCLVVIDFDRFKQLNDTFGHAEGDRALTETVETWHSEIRFGDMIGRTGGDEFAILLDRVDAYGAHQIMLRLREISPYAWSWGVAQARDGDTSESIFGRADKLLYEAKRRRGEP